MSAVPSETPVLDTLAAITVDQIQHILIAVALEEELADELDAELTTSEGSDKR